MRFFMQFISVVCHPLLMATYVTVILLLKAPELFTLPLKALNYFLLAIFLTTFIIPTFSVFSLKLFSRISSMSLSERTDRPLPFFFIFVWYGIATYLFVVRLQLDQPFSVIMITVTILIGLLLLINFKMKISIHCAAIWGAVGTLAALSVTKNIVIPEILFAGILLAGLTHTSRLYLGKHTERETWYGTLLGFGVSFLSLYFFG